MRSGHRFPLKKASESESLSSSTRRRFLTYLGVGAASTAIAASMQTMSPAAALATTNTDTGSASHFTPTGEVSGVNVVLVHGFWADGSSYSRIIPLLLAAGHTVWAPQLPLTAHLQDDVNATLAIIEHIQGPTVLVGHSYGGAVITNAGAGQAQVTGLVYASAFAPDQGEVLGQYPQAPGTANLYPVTYPNTNDTFLFLNQQKFQESFAQDVDAIEAGIMATVQKPANVTHFTDPTTSVAWKTVPSWYLISTNDRMIPPATQQMFASRMQATTISVSSSHASIVSHPLQVFSLIQAAAQASINSK